MLNSNGKAVEPPFRVPPAYVDWGLFYREIARCLDSERDFADMCDAVENVLCWTPLVGRLDPTTGERTLAMPVPGATMLSVTYAPSEDEDGFVRCRVRSVFIQGAVLAA